MSLSKDKAIFTGFDLNSSYIAGKNDNYVISIAYGGSAVTHAVKSVEPNLGGFSYVA